MGIEADVLVLVPEMRFAAEQVFHLERLAWFHSPLCQGQMKRGLMRVKGVEIDHDQHPVRTIGCGFAVAVMFSSSLR